MSEGYPVRVVETYYKNPTYDHLQDNNRVPISGLTFDSIVPCGKEPEGESVTLHETPEKPLPRGLKDGTMCVSDVWSIIALAPGMEHKI